MARRVLASYFTEDKLADTLNEFKTRGFTSEDFLIFTAESSVTSIKTHTDDIMERLPQIRRSTDTAPLMQEVKRTFSDGSAEEPPVVSLDKLLELGIQSDQASAFGSEADDGNILILIREDNKEDNSSVNVKPGDQVSAEVQSEETDDNKEN